MPMVIDVSVHVHDDRHVMLIGGTENPSHPCEISRIVYIHQSSRSAQVEPVAQHYGSAECESGLGTVPGHEVVNGEFVRLL
jgi:hypothetical protein